MKHLLGLAALAATFASPATAALFDFTYTGTGITASGQITTTDSANADGFFTVTGITGTRNGTAIDGLVAPGGLGDNDNLFKPSFAFFTDNGLTFSAGGIDYNLFTTAGGCPGFTAEGNSNDGFACTDIVAIDFQPSAAGAVPEPATWAMMIGGFGLVGGAMRARRRGDAIAAI